MADMLADGQVKVTYVAAIADIAAPSAVELNGGVNLACLITADGLAITVGEDVVSIPKLCETFNAEAPGRAQYGMTLTLVRKDVLADDLGWTTLVRNTKGFLAIRYGIEEDTTYAAGQGGGGPDGSLLIFPGASGERRPNATEANGAITFDSQWYVSSQPQLDAVAVV